jgi:uncharacterized protein (DUF2141 family)
MVEGVMKDEWASHYMHQNFLDIQAWNVDQGKICSKIFYDNQTLKQTITSCIQHQGDVVKSKSLSLAFSLLIKTSIVIDDDNTCSSCM